MAKLTPQMAQLAQSIKYRTPLNRLLGGFLALATPVVFMVASHLNWMETPEKRRRMAVMQGGFWGGMGLSLLTVHKIGFWSKNPIKAWLGFIAASTYPIIGFMAARKINQTFFSPDKDPSSMPPISLDGQDVFAPQAQRPLPEEPRYATLAPSPQWPVAPTYPTYPNYSNYPYPSEPRFSMPTQVSTTAPWPNQDSSSYTPYSSPQSIYQTSNMTMLPFYSR